jgi:acyl-CoA thioesterase
MFENARQIRPVAPGRWEATADPSWYQGRGVYGGLTTAWLGQALATLPRAGRAPRTLTIHCCAPVVAGPVEIYAQLDREGASVTHTSGRLVQGGNTVATALATFAGPRKAPEAPTRAPRSAPAVPPPDAAFPLPKGPPMPAFTDHVDYRFTHGAPPYTGAVDPLLGGWGRFVGDVVPDFGMIAALADIWPPAELSAMRAPRPAATVDMTLRFAALPEPGTAPDAWYLYEVQAGAAGEGYAEESAWLWGPDGRLLVRVDQLVALL